MLLQLHRRTALEGRNAFKGHFLVFFITLRCIQFRLQVLFQYLQTTLFPNHKRDTYDIQFYT